MLCFRSFSLTLSFAAAMAAAGCKNSGGGGTGVGGTGAGGPDSGLSRSQLLAAFGTCAANGARDFRSRAAELDSAVTDYASAPDEISKAAARQAYTAAMDSWQIMETLQFGPTASALRTGGRDFRDNIYRWPRYGRCAIEQAIVERTYESADFATPVFSNIRGLTALEYLLFYEAADTACAPPTREQWMSLSANELGDRKRAYAVAVARDVSQRAAALHDAWDPAKGNFGQTLGSAGPGNPVFASPQEALNAVSDAVFYVENDVKDMKLAPPLGLDMLLCTSMSVCPELVESTFARRSKPNIRVNLDGARRLLEGCEPGYAGLAIDDLLVMLGAGGTADRLRARAIDAQAALEAIPEDDLGEALTAHKPVVDTLYTSVKALTDILKTELVDVLNLRLPPETMGDND